MKTKIKRILCLDFDGVCHSYTSGWKGDTVIPDPPVPGLFEFIREAQEKFIVSIYSARSKTQEGRIAMRDWFMKHFIEWVKANGETFILDIDFPDHKPPAFLSIEDRAVCFDGEWPAVESLLTFQPWHKTKKRAPKVQEEAIPEIDPSKFFRATVSGAQ